MVNVGYLFANSWCFQQNVNIHQAYQVTLTYDSSLDSAKFGDVYMWDLREHTQLWFQLWHGGYLKQKLLIKFLLLFLLYFNIQERRIRFHDYTWTHNTHWLANKLITFKFSLCNLNLKAKLRLWTVLIEDCLHYVIANSLNVLAYVTHLTKDLLNNRSV